jgi:hypothetical protein
LRCYTFVVDFLDDPREWMVKAEAVGFLPFELVDPVPDSSSIGGFGSGSGDALHFTIGSRVRGHELAVSTSIGAARADDDVAARHTVLRAVESMLDDPLAFPFALHVTFEQRAVEVLVDGEPIVFRGIIASGVPEWTLQAEIGNDAVVTLQTAGDIVPLSIRRLTSLGLRPDSKWSWDAT